VPVDVTLVPPAASPRRVADRPLVRAAAAVFVIASLVAVGGPLLSYRSDVEQLRDLFRDRVAREAAFHADALAHAFHLLEGELLRLAQRPEIDPTDPTAAPEKRVLELAHRRSVLFAGVAVLGIDGRIVWSEPKNLLGEEGVPKAWVDRLTRERRPVIDAMAPGGRRFVVAVPVERDERVVGAVVGVFDPSLDATAAGRVSDDLQLIVVDGSGDVLYPTHDVPHWVNDPHLVPRVEQLLARPEGDTLGLGREDLFAAAAEVSDTGFRVVLVGSEDTVTAPVRRRFLAQLALLISLQISAVVLLAMFVQRAYRGFVAMEVRAAERNRLVALGSASSLIAHEVKNSLNGLKAATTLLRADGESQLPVGTIRAEVDRLQHLATSLLLFGKPATAQLRPTALPELVDDVVDGLRELPGADEVTITTNLPDRLDIACDPLLVTTAVQNVVRNAIEAGVAAKDLGRTTAPRVEVAVRATDAEALITVVDNAGGPTADVAGRLFTPFASGKPAGIGLGLAMARRAIEAQDGQLMFERTADGSRFTFSLPRRPAGKVD
jgi:signal transduction histidine kinase